MTIKKLLTMVCSLALGASLLAAHAHAGCSPRKPGPRGCKNEVLTCRAVRACADIPTRKERRSCKRACLTEIVTACRGGTTPCSASPSGAFLNPAAC